ncbi:DRTGG domain-containing protein [Desulfovibrio litoralis]|uniref:DRTGG domain-containing protein n=1 Tax=Desulfovibrio litoralis DSM 11393 TaxID=1121455 RepID=A0A1M7TE71_9BACT|nr:DRTGG domain-containing protein [Desulfovibrio litoralis]SHN69042.1 hypothetical protein SAMN02745728_01898 [Desulfovibrio litoralis DSM 11393]
MQSLYIASTTTKTGKNLITLALGVILQRQGTKLGYFKPIGDIPTLTDEKLGDSDALLTQEVLGQNINADILSPVVISSNLRATPFGLDSKTTQEKIQKAYQEIAKDNDMTLVEGYGSFPASGFFCGSDAISLVNSLNLKVILVEKVGQTPNYDAILYAKYLLKDSLIGVILNDLKENVYRDTNELLIPFLNKRGINILGCVPHEPELASIKATELVKGLKGQLVAGNANMASKVKGFLIGTMQVDNFMSHLAKQNNIAVIAGGDRTDIQIMALQGNCSCLVLTGNMTPSELVRTKADKTGIPIIVVKEDTYTVARNMERILKGQKLEDLNKIKIAVDLIMQHVDIDKISKHLAM